MNSSDAMNGADMNSNDAAMNGADMNSNDAASQPAQPASPADRSDAETFVMGYPSDRSDPFDDLHSSSSMDLLAAPVSEAPVSEAPVSEAPVSEAAVRSAQAAMQKAKSAKQKAKAASPKQQKVKKQSPKSAPARLQSSQSTPAVAVLQRTVITVRRGQSAAQSSQPAPAQQSTTQTSQPKAGQVTYITDEDRAWHLRGGRNSDSDSGDIGDGSDSDC